MAADEVGAINQRGLPCLRQRHFRLRRKAAERGHTVVPADSPVEAPEAPEAAVVHVSREALSEG